MQQHTFIKKDNKSCFHQLGLLGDLLYSQLLPQQLKSLDGFQGHTVCFLAMNLFIALLVAGFSDEPNCIHILALTFLI